MVQPILLDYGAATHTVEWPGDEPGQVNALRILARPASFTVAATYLPPLDPADYDGRTAISTQARRRLPAAEGIHAGGGQRPGGGHSLHIYYSERMPLYLILH